MRTCNWYRLVLLCLLSGVLLVLLNVLLCDAPQPEPCNCDCSEALSRRAAELKVFYEHETEKKIETLQRHVAISPNTHTVAPGVGENTEQPHHRLAVLVPFRNRHEELQEFVPHIHQFLTRQNVHHDIWVINQVLTEVCLGSRDAMSLCLMFNRASLLNIGFLMSRDRCDYMVMHDVDLLPLNNDLKYSYPSSGPYHISSPSLHPLYHYKTFVGGILSLTREQFEKVNGLSNLFWGWGREDDELYLRMKEAGMKVHATHVQYPTGITTGINTFRHNHDKVKRPRDQRTYNRSRKRDRVTGLDSLKYTLLSHLNMTINGAPFHFVNVELDCDRNLSPYCDDKPPK